MRRRWQKIGAVCALAGVLGSTGGLTAGTDAEEFPAYDSHQGVAIAAVPVPDTPAAEDIFGENAAPTRVGFLPVEIVITNKRAETIEVKLETVVVVSGRVKFAQVEPTLIALTLYPLPKIEKRGGTAPRRVGVPRDQDREKREEAEAGLRQAALRMARVPPGAYARGYLYFNLRGKSIDLAASSVYIPDVNVVPTDEQLLYFEISLQPYALRD